MPGPAAKLGAHTIRCDEFGSTRGYRIIKELPLVLAGAPAAMRQRVTESDQLG